MIFYVICKCAAERKNMNSIEIQYLNMLLSEGIRVDHLWKKTDVKPIFIDVHLALNNCWKWHSIQTLLIDKCKPEIDFGLQFQS